MRMRLTVEPVRSLADLTELISLHQAVFERELGLALPRLRARAKNSIMHLVARCDQAPGIVGAVTIIETDRTLVPREAYGLPFPSTERAARYTHMAVLPRYRGLNIPVRLLLEARRLFVTPRRIHYTWLLYDAARAGSSRLCSILGYRVAPVVVDAGYGPCCVLSRDEFLAAAARETSPNSSRLPRAVRQLPQWRRAS
jgi:hypothetical protein